MLEKQEKLGFVEGVVTPAARAVVEENHQGLAITMVFSEILNGLRSDLRLNFGRVLAYTVYEEFVHPWGFVEAAPRLGGPWDGYVYPLLQLKNSKWIASLPNLLFVHPDCIHYRLLTLDQVVDVLCKRPPEIAWIKD